MNKDKVKSAIFATITRFSQQKFTIDETRAFLETLAKLLAEQESAKQFAQKYGRTPKN